MKTRLLFTLAVLLAVTPLVAQNYNTAIGLRGGYTYGLTVKHFLNSTSALEGIISPRWEGVLITGLYEKHATAFDVRQLQYYDGIGAHVGLWNFHDHHHDHHPWFHKDDHDKDDHDHHNVIGADLILGLEYSFNEIPFAVGVDWKPGINLIGHQGIWLEDVAFNLRFLISR